MHVVVLYPQRVKRILQLYQTAHSPTRLLAALQRASVLYGGPALSDQTQSILKALHQQYNELRPTSTLLWQSPRYLTARYFVQWLHALGLITVIGFLEPLSIFWQNAQLRSWLQQVCPEQLQQRWRTYMVERKTSQYLEDHPKLLKVAVTDVLRYVIALEALSAPTLSLDERRQRLLTLAPHAVVTIDDFFHWLQHHGALDNGYNEILYFLREIDVLSSSSLPFSLAYTLREVAHLTRTVSSLYGQPRLTPPA